MLIPCFDSPAVIPYMTLERRPALARLVDRVDRGTASPVLKDDDVSQRTNVLDVLVSALNQLDNESKKTGGISEAEIDAIFAAMLFGSNFEDPIDIASRMIDGGTPEVVDRINTKMARDHGVLSGIARRKDAKERWEDAALELANTLDRNLTQTAMAEKISERLLAAGIKCPWEMLLKRISGWRKDGTLPRPNRKKAE